MTDLAHYVRCPRSICDKGTVFDTVNGIRQGPGYRCSVCNGVGFVESTAYQGAVDDLGAIGHAFLAYENAPLADQPNYRAELIAKVREITERRIGGQS